LDFPPRKPVETSREEIVSSVDGEEKFIITSPVLISPREDSKRIKTLNVEDSSYQYEGIYNLRDIGGWSVIDNDKPCHVRSKFVYISAAPTKATAQDISLLSDLGIKSLLDLRLNQDKFPDEYDAAIYTIFSKDRVISRSIFPNKKLEKSLERRITRTPKKRLTKSSLKSSEVRKERDTVLPDLVGLSPSILTEYSHRIVKILDYFTVWDNYPILMFCNSGKDETSLISALILSILGVDIRSIIDDYHNNNMRIPSESPLEAHLISLGWAEDLFKAPKEIMASFLYNISKNYQSVSNYLESVGFTSHKQKLIKLCLLSES